MASAKELARRSVVTGRPSDVSHSGAGSADNHGGALADGPAGQTPVGTIFDRSPASVNVDQLDSTKSRAPAAVVKRSNEMICYAIGDVQHP